MDSNHHELFATSLDLNLGVSDASQARKAAVLLAGPTYRTYLEGHSGWFAMRMRGVEPPQSYLHTDLNRIGAVSLRPGASGASKLRDFVSALDAVDGMDVVTVLSREAAVIRSLDQLRVAGISKAELARRIGRNPSSVRRLVTAQRARPELPVIVSIADELGARLEIAVRSPASGEAGRTRAAA